MTNADDDSRPTAKQRKDRTALYVLMSVFVIAMVAIFVWGDALLPSRTEGTLNSTKTERAGDVKPQGF